MLLMPNFFRYSAFLEVVLCKVKFASHSDIVGSGSPDHVLSLLQISSHKPARKDALLQEQNLMRFKLFKFDTAMLQGLR